MLRYGPAKLEGKLLHNTNKGKRIKVVLWKPFLYSELLMMQQIHMYIVQFYLAAYFIYFSPISRTSTLKLFPSIECVYSFCLKEI